MTKHTTALVVVFTLHNMEEAVFGLPGWMAEYQVGAIDIDHRVFLLSLTVVSIVSWFGLWWLHTRASGTMSLWVAALFSATLLANSFSHVALSVWTCSQMPGLLTATTLVGPMAWLTLQQSSRQLQLRTTQLFAIMIAGLVAQTTIPWILVSAVNSGLDLHATIISSSTSNIVGRSGLRIDGDPNGFLSSVCFH